MIKQLPTSSHTLPPALIHRRQMPLPATVMATPLLHIMLVTETWLPDINGVASSIYQLMRELKKMGHRITLVRPRQS